MALPCVGTFVVVLHLLGIHIAGMDAALQNVALGKLAVQESDYDGVPNAPRAVDGDLNPVFGDGSCTLTKTQSFTWWAVDLGRLTKIELVNITNRADCCGERLREFSIGVSEELPEPGGNLSAIKYQTCAERQDPVAEGATINLNCDACGRYLIIQTRYQSSILTLCEVEVYSGGETCEARQIYSSGSRELSLWPGRQELATPCDSRGGTCAPKECCPNGLYAAGCLHQFYPFESTYACCMAALDCEWRSKVEALHLWPEGNFALPQSVYGCPPTPSVQWHYGYIRIQDGPEDGTNVTKWRTGPFHHRGPYSATHFVFQSCSKFQEQLVKEKRQMQTRWPPGQYCIYKMGAQCPNGLQSGTIMLNLSQSAAEQTDYGGILAAQVTDGHVRFNFCCSSDVDITSPMSLPYKAPFILLQKGGHCPDVHLMDANEEHINVSLGLHAMNSSGVTPDWKHLVDGSLSLAFCYYQEIESCHYGEGEMYRGPADVTDLGVCDDYGQQGDRWNPYLRLDLQYTNNGNKCRNTRTLKPPGPICIVSTKEGVFHSCGVPHCEPLADYVMARTDIAVRQITGDSEKAHLVLDGDISTCLMLADLHKPWIQMNLGRTEEVLALEFLFDRGTHCILRLGSISVARDEADFLTGGALYCTWNVSVSVPVPFIRCLQPVSGQYVTVRNTDHWEFDGWPDKGDFQYTCFTVCEIKVFIRDEVSCDQPLGLPNLHPVSQVRSNPALAPADAYSWLPGGAQPWCIHPADTHPFLEIDLLYPYHITAFSTQTSKPPDDAMATVNFQILLYYGTQGSEGHMSIYQEFLGRDKVFVHRKPVDGTQTHGLLFPVVARMLRLSLEEPRQDHALCLHVGIFGCPRSLGNSAEGGEVEISSAFAIPRPPQHVTDGLATTWSRTDTEWDPWISVTLDRPLVVEHIVVKNDYSQFNHYHKMCYEAADQGFSYGGPDNITETGADCMFYNEPPGPDYMWDFKKIPEGTIENSRNLCRNPEKEPAPWCYSFNGNTYWEFCDSPKCVDYKFVLEAEVGATSSGQTSWTLCQKKEFSGRAVNHGFYCSLPKVSQHVKVTFKGYGFFLAHEIQAFGRFDDDLPTVTTDKGVMEVSCPEGQVLYTVSSSFSSTLPATPGVLLPNWISAKYLQGSCLDAGSRSCQLLNSWPVGPEYDLPQNNTGWQHLYCSPYTKKQGKCWYVVEDEPTAITSTDYLSQLDRSTVCHWEVRAPPGKYVQINITAFKLAQPEKPKQLTWQSDGGACEDTLTVQYPGLPEPIRVTQPILLVSPASNLSLQLSTCHRVIPGDVMDVGLEAVYTQIGCAGCGVQEQCSGPQSCWAPCGVITSPGFPSVYQNNVRCLWLITVDPQSYIQLELVHVDIYERDSATCQVDYVEVKDQRETLEGTDEQSLGRYCNQNRPRVAMLSSWNQMAVEFVSDQSNTASGFMAYYRSIAYTAPDRQTNHTSECVPGWTWFDRACYKMEVSVRGLTWTDAEAQCMEQQSHLVSIKGMDEAKFLHSLILQTTPQAGTDIYIGLTDRDVEANWKWTDYSPLSFSNWHVSPEGISQPDGVNIEDCTVIRLQAIRLTQNWHDIPCAYRGVHHFICQAPISESEKPYEMQWGSNLGGCGDQVTLFTCATGECILQAHVCDGQADCDDSSDEAACVPEAGTCETGYFQCGSGECISLDLYCDFQTQCSDHSDEASCVYRECEADEYKCHNGQCIDDSKHCDLLSDCLDDSDELDCEKCSAASTMQCYDGTCIAASRVCDGTIDCQGSLHEDEALQTCTSQKESCLDWRRRGFTQSGKYRINPGGLETVEVECDFDIVEGQVVTLVHHNSEDKILDKGFEADASYLRDVIYHIPIMHIKAIKAMSQSCEQYFRVTCQYSGAFINSWWRDLDGQKRSYNYPEAHGEPPCTCIVNRSCREKPGRHKCFCSEDIKYAEYDEGYIQDNGDLPLTQLTLSDTGSSIEFADHIIGPLKCYQAVNKSELELSCGNAQSYNPSLWCLFDRDHYDVPQACRDGTHLRGCRNYSCPVGFSKCLASYCIPVRMVCDGQADCPNGEDELQCERRSCPGMYRCQGTEPSPCVPLEQRCDGQRHCPLGDDEKQCLHLCPHGCQCRGLSAWCRNASLERFPPVMPGSRLVDLSNNAVELQQGDLHLLHYLGVLLLSGNGLTRLPVGLFQNLANLYSLDLSRNLIEVLEVGVLAGLGNLQSLYLSDNPLMFVEPLAFVGLVKLPTLKLSGHHLETIDAGVFDGLTALETLDLSDNGLIAVNQGGFRNLKKLKNLYIGNNLIDILGKDDLTSLSSLQYLVSDEYKFCCLVPNVDQSNCFPKPDQFSSCEDLMKNNILRSFLWIMGIFAFVGNLFVLIWRRSQRSAAHGGGSVGDILITNLACADFFMGLYMIAIASVDAYFRGIYIENSKQWTSSWVCQTVGVIATLSSEASVLILLAITLDRFITISFPVSSARFSRKTAVMLSVATWVVAGLLALIPLIPGSYFQGKFYSRSGVCISIHLTNEVSPGWEYSVAIYHGLNFVVFLVIFVVYAYIYHKMKTSARRAGSKHRREMSAARKMALIVITDFCCWVPINVMGMLAMAGVHIPGEVYAWTVVFILPINSAINPILYTIASMQLQKGKKDGPNVSSNMTSSTVIIEILEKDVTDDPDRQSLDQCLTSSNTKLAMSTRNLMAVCQRVGSHMARLHGMGLGVGKLSTKTVLTKQNDKSGWVEVAGIEVEGNLGALEPGDDIEMFGKLVRTMLQQANKNRLMQQKTNAISY